LALFMKAAYNVKREVGMSRYNPIKIIKRAEREQAAQVAAGGAAGGGMHSESSAQDEASEMAATVKNWISEFRQTRQARDQEFEQQLGWRQGDAN
jgi:hypothetical protein